MYHAILHRPTTPRQLASYHNRIRNMNDRRKGKPYISPGLCHEAWRDAVFHPQALDEILE